MPPLQVLPREPRRRRWHLHMWHSDSSPRDDRSMGEGCSAEGERLGRRDRHSTGTWTFGGEGERGSASLVPRIGSLRAQLLHKLEQRHQHSAEAGGRGGGGFRDNPRATSLERTSREHAALASSSPSLREEALAEASSKELYKRSSSTGSGPRHRAGWLRRLFLVRRTRSEGSERGEGGKGKGEGVSIEGVTVQNAENEDASQGEEEEWLKEFLCELKSKEEEARCEAEADVESGKRKDDFRGGLVEKALRLGLKLPLSAICEETEEEVEEQRDPLMRWTSAF